MVQKVDIIVQPMQRLLLISVDVFGWEMLERAKQGVKCRDLMISSLARILNASDLLSNLPDMVQRYRISVPLRKAIISANANSDIIGANSPSRKSRTQLTSAPGRSFFMLIHEQISLDYNVWNVWAHGGIAALWSLTYGQRNVGTMGNGGGYF